jgi:cephalosporin hydroxylase
MHPPIRLQESGCQVTQSEYEFQRLVDLYRSFQPANILEIGTYRGGTLFFWLKYGQPGSKIVVADTFQYLQNSETHMQAWSQQAHECRIQLHIVKGDTKSPETTAKIRELMPEVDFLFIDGDHTYDGVANDFETYAPLVKKGGIVALHDIINFAGQPENDVARYWKLLQRRGFLTREFIENDNPQWMGIGLVYIE